MSEALPDGFDFATTDSEAELAKLDPAFARLLEKERGLRARREEIRSSLRRILDAERIDDPGRPRLPAPVSNPAGDPRNAGAVRLLGDLVDEVFPAADGPLTQKATDAMRAREISDEMADIDRALAMLREPLRRARTAAALALWRVLEPEFKASVQAYIAAARATDTARLRFAKVRDRLAHFDVPLPFPVSHRDVEPLTSGRGYLARLADDAAATFA